MANDGGRSATYPALLGLLGTMTGDWRAVKAGALEYLTAVAGSAEGVHDADAVVGELDHLLSAASSEFHYVQVVVESGANFSPYGEFDTAADFLGKLRARLADPRTSGVDDPAGSSSSGPRPDDAGAAQPADSVADEYPVLRRLLRPLWSGWRDASDDVTVVDYLGTVIRDLADLAGQAPEAVVSEVDQLLAAGWSQAGHVRFLSDAGAYDVAAGDVEAFWRDVRDRAAELAEEASRPEPDGTRVTEEILAALDHGELGRALTGLARRYAIPRLRSGDLAHFRATVGPLLDRVLPQWVERYVDDLCYAAQCVSDDVDWTRARWMRSAVELLLTEYADTDAAAFVDTDQVALVDGLLDAHGAAFGRTAGSPDPELPDSHWWWAGSAGKGPQGHPVHLRWYRGWAAWQARPTPAADAPGEGVSPSRDLVARMVRAALVGFAGLLRSRAASVSVGVLDPEGHVSASARSLPARVIGERLVVDDAEVAGLPSGERVITSATVRGTIGSVTASWSAELLGGRAGAGQGWTTLVVDGPLATDDDAALGSALQAWEDELEVSLSDWSSAATPTLIGRYGHARETFAHDPPRAHPLLTGISRHLWDGDLLPGLAGIARVHSAGLFDEVDRSPWETDWQAALRHLDTDGWDEFLGRLVRWTRELTDDDWYLLCAARSGIQFVAEEMPRTGLPGRLRPGVGTLDDAMRTFGHRYGPIALAAVPARLHRRHKWWRYPAGTPSVGASIALHDLVMALRAELDLPAGDRASEATDDVLRQVLRGCEQVLDGRVPGFRVADAQMVDRLVVDALNSSATLSGQLLGYFQPIAHHAASWPLPPDVAERE